jgi:hydrogenase maturation protease
MMRTVPKIKKLMNDQVPKVLVMCYGNPGRLDDGLGAAFGEALEAMALPAVQVDIDYQLTVEDAIAVSRHDVVIFADAAVAGREPFFFKKLKAIPTLSFSSHSLDPENILAMTRELFGSCPQGYALGIRGYEYNEFGETLSPKAQQNLVLSLQSMLTVIKSRKFEQFAADLETIQDEDQANYDGDMPCKMENM